MKIEPKNLQHSSQNIALSKDTIIAKRMLIFFKKTADISKFKRALVLKDMFSETKCLCVLTYQFRVSNIILTSFKPPGLRLTIYVIPLF